MLLCGPLFLGFGCDAFLLSPCPGAPTWSEVGAGYTHVCALTPEGEAICTPDAATSAPPAGPWTHLVSGYDFACALDPDGWPACWGDAAAMGGAAPDMSAAYGSLDAGLSHVCGVRVDGRVGCWGANRDGQATVPASVGEVVTVSAGFRHTCAIASDGALSCWGAAGAWLPDAVETTFTQVAAGHDQTCAVDLAGDVLCWGEDLPDQSPLGGMDVAALAAGALGICALGTDGAVACALSETAEIPAGAFSDLDLSPARAASGLSYGCVLDLLGALECFGGDIPNLPTGLE